MRIAPALCMALVATSAAAESTAASPGHYLCSLPGAGIFNLTVENGTRYSTHYTGKAPKSGDYRNTEGKLQFTSGPIEGNHGKVMSPTKIGLSSSAATRSFYAVCNMKK
jgi:hypothetical protein